MKTVWGTTIVAPTPESVEANTNAEHDGDDGVSYGPKFPCSGTLISCDILLAWPILDLLSKPTQITANGNRSGCNLGNKISLWRMSLLLR